MSDEIADRRIAFLATDGVEQVELDEPWRAVTEAGGTAVLIAPDAGDIQAYNHLDAGDRRTAEMGLDEARAEDFDALVLPGGVHNPDVLRTDERARRFVRAFFEQHKPVGVICHGPWTLIDAGVVEGRTLTSWPSLRTDLVNAGATWVDEQVHVDAGLVSSRNPDDLPAFCDKIVEEFAEGAHEQQTA
jgi:protease I